MTPTLAPDLCSYAAAPNRSVSVTIGYDRLSDSITASRSAPFRDDLPVVRRLFAAIAKAHSRDNILVTPTTFSRTLAFLELLPADVPAPEVVIESEHEIGLDWDESYRRVVTVTVDGTSRLGFSSLIGEDLQQGRLEFAEGAQQIPRALGILFSQLYPRWQSRTGGIRFG